VPTFLSKELAKAGFHLCLVFFVAMTIVVVESRAAKLVATASNAMAIASLAAPLLERWLAV